MATTNSKTMFATIAAVCAIEEEENVPEGVLRYIKLAQDVASLVTYEVRSEQGPKWQEIITACDEFEIELLQLKQFAMRKKPPGLEGVAAAGSEPLEIKREPTSVVVTGHMTYIQNLVRVTRAIVNDSKWFKRKDYLDRTVIVLQSIARIKTMLNLPGLKRKMNRKIRPDEWQDQMDSRFSEPDAGAEGGGGLLKSAVNFTRVLFNQGEEDSPAQPTIDSSDISHVDIPRRVLSQSTHLAEKSRSEEGNFNQEKGADVMNFHDRASVGSLVAVCHWSTSDVPGTEMFKRARVAQGYASNGLNIITPCMPYAFDSSTQVNAVYTHTFLSYVSQFYHYWRGSLRFVVEVVATKLHQGQLYITTHPWNGMTSSLSQPTFPDTWNCYAAKIDLKLCNRVAFEVVYNSFTDHLNTFPNGHAMRDPRATQQSQPGVPFATGLARPTGIGNLYIYVLNPLSVTGTVVSGTVDVNVELYPGKDFQMHGLRPIWDEYLLDTVYVGEDHSADAPDIRDQMDNGESVETKEIAEVTQQEAPVRLAPTGVTTKEGEQLVVRDVNVRKSEYKTTISRMFPLKTGIQWTTSQVFGTIVMREQVADLLNQRQLSLMALTDYVNYFRTTLEFTLQFNAQPMLAGKAWLLWTPTTLEVTNTANMSRWIPNIQQMAAIAISPQTDTEVKLQIPWGNVHRAVSTRISTSAFDNPYHPVSSHKFGTVYVVVQNQLRTGAGGSTNLTLTLMGQLKNTYLGYKKGHEVQGVTRVEDQADEVQMEGINDDLMFSGVRNVNVAPAQSNDEWSGTVDTSMGTSCGGSTMKKIQQRTTGHIMGDHFDMRVLMRRPSFLWQGYIESSTDPIWRHLVRFSCRPSSITNTAVATLCHTWSGTLRWHVYTNAAAATQLLMKARYISDVFQFNAADTTTHTEYTARDFTGATVWKPGQVSGQVLQPPHYSPLATKYTRTARSHIDQAGDIERPYYTSYGCLEVCTQYTGTGRIRVVVYQSIGDDFRMYLTRPPPEGRMRNPPVERVRRGSVGQLPPLRPGTPKIIRSHRIEDQMRDEDRPHHELVVRTMRAANIHPFSFEDKECGRIEATLAIMKQRFWTYKQEGNEWLDYGLAHKLTEIARAVEFMEHEQGRYAPIDLDAVMNGRPHIRCDLNMCSREFGGTCLPCGMLAVAISSGNYTTVVNYMMAQVLHMSSVSLGGRIGTTCACFLENLVNRCCIDLDIGGTSIIGRAMTQLLRMSYGALTDPEEVSGCSSGQCAWHLARAMMTQVNVNMTGAGLMLLLCGWAMTSLGNESALGTPFQAVASCEMVCRKTLYAPIDMTAYTPFMASQYSGDTWETYKEYKMEWESWPESLRLKMYRGMNATRSHYHSRPEQEFYDRIGIDRGQLPLYRRREHFLDFDGSYGIREMFEGYIERKFRAVMEELRTKTLNRWHIFNDVAEDQRIYNYYRMVVMMELKRKWRWTQAEKKYELERRNIHSWWCRRKVLDELKEKTALWKSLLDQDAVLRSVFNGRTLAQELDDEPNRWIDQADEVSQALDAARMAVEMAPKERCIDVAMRQFTQLKNWCVNSIVGRKLNPKVDSLASLYDLIVTKILPAIAFVADLMISLHAILTSESSLIRSLALTALTIKAAQYTKIGDQLLKQLKEVDWSQHFGPIRDQECDWNWVSNIAATLVSTVAGTLVMAAGGVFSKGDEKSLQKGVVARVAESAATFGKLVTGARGMSWCWTAVKDSISDGVLWFLEGNDELDGWYKKNRSAVAKWLERADLLYQANAFDANHIFERTDGKTNFSRLVELSEMARKIRAHVTGTSPIPVAAQRTAERVLKTMAWAEKAKESAIRTEPIGIWIEGGPGLGKSFIASSFLPFTLLAEVGLMDDVKEFEHQIWMKPTNPEHQYFDGYFSQNYVVLDDFGCSTEDKDAAEIIPMISCAKTVALMAAVDDKMTLFNSKFVVITTNQKSVQVMESVRDKSALIRRMPFSYTLCVKKKWLKDDKVDIEAVLEFIRKEAPSNYRSLLARLDEVWEFAELNLSSGFESSKRITFTNLVLKIAHEYRKRTRTDATLGALLKGVLPVLPQALKTEVKDQMMDPERLDDVFVVQRKIQECVNIEDPKTKYMMMDTMFVSQRRKMWVVKIRSGEWDWDTVADDYLALGFSTRDELISYAMAECESMDADEQQFHAAMLGILREEIAPQGTTWRGLKWWLISLAGAAVAAAMIYGMIYVVRTCCSTIIEDQAGQYDKAGAKQPVARKAGAARTNVLRAKLTDQDGENVDVGKFTALRRNIVKVEMRRSDKIPVALWGLLVDSSTLLLPNHFVMRVRGETDPTKQVFVEVKSKRGLHLTWVPISLTAVNTCQLTESSGYFSGNRDLAVVKLVDQVFGVRSVRSMIMHHDDRVKHREGRRTGYFVSPDEIERCAVMFDTQHENKRLERSLAGKVQNPTTVGDCGRMYYLQGRHVVRPLVGLHVWGVGDDTDVGIADFSLEMIENAEAIIQENIDTVLGIDSFELEDEEGVEFRDEMYDEQWYDAESDFVGGVVWNEIPLQRHQPNKTAFCKTGLDHPEWDDEFSPPIIGEVAGKHTLHTNVQKFNPTAELTVPVSLHQHIVNYMKEQITEVSEELELPEDEVLNGCAGLSPLVLDTSPGFVRNYFPEPGKSGILERDDDGVIHLTEAAKTREMTHVGKTFEQHYLDEAQRCREAKAPRVLWEAVNKDELLKHSKVKIGKVRVFVAPSLEFTLLQRKFFGRFIAWMRNQAGFKFCHGIGNDKERVWRSYFNRMLEVGDEGFDLDYSNFDGTVTTQAFNVIGHLADAFYGGKGREARWSILYAIHHSYIIVGRSVIFTHQGNKSGNPATDIFNSIANWYNILVAFTFSQMMAGLPRNVSEFPDKVRCLTYGDDVILTATKHTLEFFNRQSCFQALQPLGYEVTGASKTEGIVPTDKIVDLTFLKSHFVEQDGIMTAPLPKAVIYRDLMWTKKVNVGDDVILQMKVDAAELMSYHWGKDFSEKLAREVNEVGRSMKQKYSEWRNMVAEMQDECVVPGPRDVAMRVVMDDWLLRDAPSIDWSWWSD